MASAILSAFPRPPTHIPTSPLPATPSTSRPTSPHSLRSKTPEATSRSERRLSRGSSKGGHRRTNSHGESSARHLRTGSGERLIGERIISGEGLPRMSMESTTTGAPRMSLESSIAFAGPETIAAMSPTESNFSHATATVTTAYTSTPVWARPSVTTKDGKELGSISEGEIARVPKSYAGVGVSGATSDSGGKRVSHYENLRRSLGGDASQRSSGYRDSLASGEGAMSSGSSSHGGGLLSAQSGPGSALSSRPGSFIGPGTPPLNVPLSASARVAALRAKRANLNHLNLTNGSGSSSPVGDFKASLATLNALNKRVSWGSVASAGPPPTTPLPPLPSTPASQAPSSYAPSAIGSDGKRKSINLNSPVMTSYPFPSLKGEGGSSVPPSAMINHAAFHRSSPSGATFGHGFEYRPTGLGGGRGDHSRGSSFGSATEGGRMGSTVYGGESEFKLGSMGNGSVATFGRSVSDFGEELASQSNSSGSKKAAHHQPNFSASSMTSVGTTTPAKNVDSWRGRDSFRPESFQGGLAALSAGLNRSSDGSPGSSNDSRAKPPPILLRTPINSTTGFTSLTGNSFISASPEESPIDVEKEMELLKKKQKRASSGSIMSTMSTRTNGTFRGAASRVMDVNAEELGDDEAAEMAGERLLGSVGDGLEGLGSLSLFGGKKSKSRLGVNSNGSSRPSSASFVRKTSGSGGVSPAIASSAVDTPGSQYSQPEDADQTITLSRAPSLAVPNADANRDSVISFYSGPFNESMETFESGVVGSGSNFASRLSATVDDQRSSNGSSVGGYLVMKRGAVPKVTVESEGTRTPMAFMSKPLPPPGDGQERLVNIAVWNDVPPTPKTGDSNWATSPSTADDGRLSIDRVANSASLTSGGRPSMESTLTARLARSPSPSGTSFHSHSTIMPNKPSSSSAKPSIDLDRPDSAMSTSSRKRFPPPPALSISRATPLSSQASLVLQDMDGMEEDDVLASPSAGRDQRGKGPSGAGKHKGRASEDFAKDLEKDMDSEFALLQEVAIREKRIKLALFGRAPSTPISRPTDRRPQSVAVMTKRLPRSPIGGDSPRGDGASSPELEDMIRQSKRSLSSSAKKAAMRRRRSTGALRHYPLDAWSRTSHSEFRPLSSRKSDAASITTEDGGRRGMDINRDGVRVRDSMVLDLSEDRVDFPELEDLAAESDSSIDLHTPLPRLMVRAGLLSPNSKVLRPPTPEEDPRMSYMSKGGLKVPHDKRNTEKRKRRHRDGKLLREGVGLTTGLGWSDSEDEDAPSPLTRRLSSMTLGSNVTRKASLASSMNSFARSSMTSLNLSRSPSLPSIPAGTAISAVSLASKHSSSGSETAPRRSRQKALTIVEHSSYGRPEVNNIKPALKPSSTMSIIEHAQMLPTATLYSKNHPLGSGVRRSPYDFNIPTAIRPSSPAGDSSQSSNGGVNLPVTPDADLPPSLTHHGSFLKDMSTPEDIQGVSGGSSLMSASGLAGTGLAGLAYGRGRSWTSPPSPSPNSATQLPEDSPPPIPRAAEVRYSGGNFSYPTSISSKQSMEGQIEPSTPKPVSALRKPAPRGLQPLTLPTVVAAGGRLSPRAGGTFALPSSPSLIAQNTTTPKKTSIPLPGSSLSKSTSNIAAVSTPSVSLGRARSGSQGSTAGAAVIVSTPARTSSRMPQPARHRTLSGGGGIVQNIEPAIPPVPPTPTPVLNASNTGSLRKSLGGLKSIVSARSTSETASAVPKMLGVSRATSAPGTPPARIGGPVAGKTGTGMTYRKSAGSAAEVNTTPTPARSRLPPPSATRLAAPGFYSQKNSSNSSLTSSAVGLAL